MNSYSIRFIHWLFGVRNDTVKHSNSRDIYFKGCITNNFLITILLLLRLLPYYSPTFFPQIARCKSSTYSERSWRNRMLLVESPEFISLFVPVSGRWLPPNRRCPTLDSRTRSCEAQDTLMQVVICCLSWEAEPQLGVFAGGWKPFSFAYAPRSLYASVCVGSQSRTHR